MEISKTDQVFYFEGVLNIVYSEYRDIKFLVTVIPTVLYAYIFIS